MSDPRPCQNNMKCIYNNFDYQENTNACGIDFEGVKCPYVKPYGKKKYKKDHEFLSSIVKLFIVV